MRKVHTSVFELHALSRPPAVGRVSANTAIKDYGWILENEIRTCVVEPFRQAIAKDSHLFGQAHADSREFSRDKFLKYLILKNPEISLGTMIGALKDCLHSNVSTHVAFARFVQIRFPRLSSALRAIEVVNDYRDRASHPMQLFDKDAAAKVGSSCRETLDSLWTTEKGQPTSPTV